MNEADGKTAGQASEPDRDDQDLAALFHAQDNSPPDLLSDRILAAAHDAVSADNADNADQVSHRSADESSGTVTRSQRWQTSGRWMAVAASVLLAVTVVPLMLRSPDSAMESDAFDSSRMKAVQGSLSLSAESVAPAVEAELTDAHAGAPSRREAASWTDSAAPVVTPSGPMVPAIQARKRSGVADEVERDDGIRGVVAGEVVADTDFRNTPETWIEHIRQLQEDERYDEAVVEYKMFRLQYPRHKPGFSIPLRP